MSWYIRIKTMRCSVVTGVEIRATLMTEKTIKYVYSGKANEENEENERGGSMSRRSEARGKPVKGDPSPI